MYNSLDGIHTTHAIGENVGKGMIAQVIKAFQEARLSIPSSLPRI